MQFPITMKATAFPNGSPQVKLLYNDDFKLQNVDQIKLLFLYALNNMKKDSNFTESFDIVANDISNCKELECFIETVPDVFEMALRQMMEKRRGSVDYANVIGIYNTPPPPPPTPPPTPKMVKCLR